MQQQTSPLQCYNEPYTGELAALGAQQSRVLQRLLLQRRVPPQHTLPPLIQAYQLLFGARMHPYVRKLVSEALARNAVSPQHMGKHSALRGNGADRRPGYVYCFWDEDADPGGTPLKIGATALRVRHPAAGRVSQWRRELQHERVHLLFAFATPAPFYTEELLHALLTCEQAPLRVNPVTQRRLREFFFIRDYRALHALMHITALHVRETRK